MKKNIYIHIGLHKTGTTTIQASLFRHREMWAARGYCVPEISRGYPYHHGLVEKWAHFNERYRCGLTPDESWNSVIRSFEKSKLNNAIISSEEFTNYEINEQALHFIKNKLRDYNVKIILFLRRQDDFIESAFKEIRKHIKISNFRSYWNEYVEQPSVHLDYVNLVQMWQGVFGVENIVLFDYQKLKSDDTELLTVFEDLCGASNVECDSGQVEKSNVSQGSITQGLYDVLGLTDTQIDSEKLDRMKTVIENHTSKHDLVITLLPYEIRQQITDQYISKNIKIDFNSTEFFKGRESIKYVSVEELLEVRPLRNALLKSMLL